MSDTALMIIFTGLLIYPVLSLLLILLTRKKNCVQKKLLYVFSSLSAITLFGLWMDISTTCFVVDWILVSIIYLTVCCFLWKIVFLKGYVYKITGIILMCLFFGLGYMMSTIGIIGTGLIIEQEVPDYEKWISENLIYREYRRGNAIDYSNEKRVEIHKTLSWLPFIEWPVCEEIYDKEFIYEQTPLNILYDPEENRLVLSISTWWADTLIVK